jgi:hypothetical protein
MTSTIVQIENDISGGVKAAADTLTGLLGGFESFLASSGNTDGQQAVAHAAAAVGAATASIETAITPVVDDIVNIILDKIPGGVLVTPVADAIINGVITKLLAAKASPAVSA